MPLLWRFRGRSGLIWPDGTRSVGTVWITKCEVEKNCGLSIERLLSAYDKFLLLAQHEPDEGVGRPSETTTGSVAKICFFRRVAGASTERQGPLLVAHMERP